LLDTNGALLWNTFLGSGGDDSGYGITVDAGGNAHVTGVGGATWGSPIRPFTSGNNDAFVAKIAADSNTAVLTTTSPNGGESWLGGSSQNITWTTTGTIANVKIEYSTNGGSSYTTIVASIANTGTFAWTVPNTASANCLVRISEAASGTPSDVSDSVFAISVTPPTIALGRTRLDFGAIAGDVVTKSQTVMLSNAGGGTLAWTAASDRTWLSVAPASGTGAAALKVTVDPAGLTAGRTAGAYSGFITISDPAASNNPQTIAVYLTIKGAGTSTVPFGEFSTPIDGTAGIAGAIPVTGWTLDDIEVVRIDIKRDPHAGDPAGAIGPDGLVFVGFGLFVEGARPDVESAYPGFPFNYRAGWGYMLLTNFLPAVGNGTFRLHAFALDKEGNQVLLGSKTIVCDNAHATIPFGTIDTPAQGGNTYGNQYVNFGWVLTPLPKTVPKDGSTIQVYVDGQSVGDLKTAPNVYDQYRVDMATAFPGLNNSNGPVGAFYLDTTKYANGVHTIHWIARDDQGAADGIGSRYFNIGTASQTLVSIAVTPANPSITLGTTQQFKATGAYSDGSARDITASAAWNSSNSGIASINAGGLAASLAIGSTTITAALGGITGSATLTVSAASPIKLFNVGESPVISDILESSAGHILVAGSQNNQRSVYVLKLDAAANQVWNKYYPAGTYVSVCHIYELSPDDYLVTGDIDATQGALFKMPLTGSGTASPSTQVDDWLSTVGWDTVRLPNGSIVYAGFTDIKDNGTTQIPYGDALLTGVNTAGTQYFRQNYNFAEGNSDVFYALVATSDGGFAVLLRSGYGYKMYVIITDSGGNIKKAVNIDNYTGIRMITAADGGLVIAGRNAESRGVVVKLNSSGDKVWEYVSYFDSTDYAPQTIVRASDGTYLVAGSIHMGDEVYKTFVFKLDDAGRRVW